MRLSTEDAPSAQNYPLALKCARPQLCTMARAGDSQRRALRQFIEKHDLKIKPWSRDAGIADGTLRNFLAGRSGSITLSSLQKLAYAAGSTVAEMIGEPLPETTTRQSDVVAIKRLNVRAAMGGGYEVLEEGELEPIFFRRDWVESLLRHEPGQLRAIDLDGDSNLPTLNDGDIGLVRLYPKFEPGRFYVIWDGRGLIVKRVDTVLGSRPKLRIISDNSETYPPYEVDANDVVIIARLVWRGGAI